MADFNSPAMQPMVQMAMSHVKQQFPAASPQELQAKAMEMMQDMTSHLQTVNFRPVQQQQASLPPEGEGRTNLEQLFNM